MVGGRLLPAGDEKSGVSGGLGAQRDKAGYGDCSALERWSVSPDVSTPSAELELEEVYIEPFMGVGEGNAEATGTSARAVKMATLRVSGRSLEQGAGETASLDLGVAPSAGETAWLVRCGETEVKRAV